MISSLSIIVPACNEADQIGDAIMASRDQAVGF